MFSLMPHLNAQVAWHQRYKMNCVLIILNLKNIFLFLLFCLSSFILIRKPVLVVMLASSGNLCRMKNSHPTFGKLFTFQMQDLYIFWQQLTAYSIIHYLVCFEILFFQLNVRQQRQMTNHNPAEPKVVQILNSYSVHIQTSAIIAPPRTGRMMLNLGNMQIQRYSPVKEGQIFLRVTVEKLAKHHAGESDKSATTSSLLYGPAVKPKQLPGFLCSRVPNLF